MKFFSGLFSLPATISYAIFFITMFYSPGFGNGVIAIWIVTFIFLDLIPVLPVYLLYLKGYTDMSVSNRYKRTIFYTISIISYIFAINVFSAMNSHIMSILFKSLLYATLALFIINFFWKISAHATGIGVSSTALIYIFGIYAIPFLSLVPVIFWLRIKLKAHSIEQLLLGFLISSTITYYTFLTLL